MALVESIQLVKTVPCLAEPGKIIVFGRPSRTIDGILPLVAAVAPSVVAFNPLAGQLTLRRRPGLITFYADKVMMLGIHCGDGFDEFHRHVLCGYFRQKLPAERFGKQPQYGIFRKVRAVEQSLVKSALTGVFFEEPSQSLSINKTGPPGSL